MKNEILKIAGEVLTDDDINQIIKDKFKDAVRDACDSAFRWGDIKRSIEKKIEEVMVPYIEAQDFSEYLPKLDTVLTQIINSDNCIGQKKILQNFQSLMTEPEYKEIKLTDVFGKWVEYCENVINTDGLEICYDDGVSYRPVECTMEFNEGEKRSWSSFRHANVVFQNEHDKKLNVEIRLCKYEGLSRNDEGYTISLHNCTIISSLRSINDFELFLIRLERAGTKIIIDSEYEPGEIQPDEEPEATYS